MIENLIFKKNPSKLEPTNQTLDAKHARHWIQ
jgi:hypothetical protein